LGRLQRSVQNCVYLIRPSPACEWGLPPWLLRLVVGALLEGRRGGCGAPGAGVARPGVATSMAKAAAIPSAALVEGEREGDGKGGTRDTAESWEEVEGGLEGTRQCGDVGNKCGQAAQGGKGSGGTSPLRAVHLLQASRGRGIHHGVSYVHQEHKLGELAMRR
jgi:hypothetical protein